MNSINLRTKKITTLFILLAFIGKFLQFFYHLYDFNKEKLTHIQTTLLISFLFSILCLTIIIWGNFVKNVQYSFYVMILSFIELVLIAILYDSGQFIEKPLLIADLVICLLNTIMMSYILEKFNQSQVQVQPSSEVQSEEFREQIELTNISILRVKYKVEKHNCSLRESIVIPISIPISIPNVVPNSEQTESECERCPCAICQEICHSQLVYKLNCDHLYHQDCLEGWIRSNINFTCPICRESLLGL